MRIIDLPEIDSTNNYAKEKIAELQDKDVILAEIQTNGRGRLNREWLNSGKNNIFMSIVLKPSIEFREHFANITQYLSVIVSQVLEEYGTNPKIKWPNDVLINNKKIAGILSESIVQGSNFKGIILGVGINLNCEKDFLNTIDKPATALNIEINKDIDKKEFVQKLLDKFFLGYNIFLEEGFSLIEKEYSKRASFLNKKISVNSFNESVTGVAEKINSNGALVVRDDNDCKHTFLIGDIS